LLAGEGPRGPAFVIFTSAKKLSQQENGPHLGQRGCVAMAHVVVPALTSPVHLTSVDDLNKVDLHSKYCQVLASYEALIVDRNEERRNYELQLTALRRAMSEQTFSPSAKHRSDGVAHELVELELERDQLEEKVQLPPRRPWSFGGELRLHLQHRG